MKVYGIKNCDTVKKARKFLEEAGVAYSFHDYKKDGVDAEKLRQFVSEFGWEMVLNRKGTTWRKLDDETQDGVTNAETAIEVMLEHPSTIKRPIAEGKNKILLGYDPVAWEMSLELGELV
ncbi:ArsC family reductase [Roseibium suaedae]|uniref:Arsenate reductase n=1 Tax=Roseibium suaedae TaxID=735517 RepID=A0A1M7M7M2_9HYPH|nr:ArsC family reductase [Roseibium suaedae]SHM86712.1 arsenate reductase [Roseibium suaedae]